MFLKIKLKKNTVDLTGNSRPRTIYLDVTFETPVAVLGYEIDPKTMDAKGCKYKDGILHETKHLILRDAIESTTPMYEDLKYGFLTTMTLKQQKKKYGFEKF